ncbi:hypothetical protein JQ557_13595 [Bradyrhizobium sp. U87765 SZCCT0131]|uniref:hypothetical protein n=1 Tax=unclassified Bradyrhizobium TaxID=2631580 RepID=UPI001BAE3449|nr:MULTISPECIES: hypothetical protein [unclassified Bradyrhizobium]MBR1219032.1 hypothetical protein [Bradyrhizobium sp. U87765 SZCCT0131]MBR1261683.1 hypothetical protein [Bradyrhizobium sp. U87765 SZCCT0134]MBR1306464.1 hypothetical protein [Bradyrhizobium sp. U87765 SZCCT0110]MBR1317465.1 hypothetical protein [Bradyrhizobium sp. U87765 SZCCT0109]MBR1351167.1 hypothetical protein [Bradyrhizobium sp. U87765 SZCCT0048]
MRAQPAASAAAAVRSGAAIHPLFLIGRAAAVAAVVAAGGCTPPRPAIGADPADPAARVAPVRAAPVIDRYESLRPQTPAAWPAQNRRVTPDSGER